MVGELSFCDVTRKADMSRSGLDREAAVEAAKVAAVPGATEQRGKLAGFAAEGMENGREFLREQEKTAVGDRWLTAQRMQDGGRCGATGGDAMRRPERVCFGKEAGDLAPTGSFAGLARFADEDHKEIETVARGADTAVRGWAGEVAEGGQELEEDRSRIGFGVWGEARNDATRDTVECRDGERGWWQRVGSPWKRGRWPGGFAGVGVLGARVLEFLGLSLLFLLILEGWSRRLPRSLDRKELSIPAVYVLECWLGVGRA
jgi:hypothetical protein